MVSSYFKQNTKHTFLNRTFKHRLKDDASLYEAKTAVLIIHLVSPMLPKIKLPFLCTIVWSKAVD